jgi:hypothetical protein
MIELKDQVCSLELAIRLNDLFVKQESLFYWHNIDTIPSVICSHWYPERSGDFWISAFTVAELGKMIPFTIVIDNKTLYCNSMIGYTKHGYEPTVSYDSHKDDDGEAIVVIDFSDTNEANARAKMLIYLLENGLING